MGNDTINYFVVFIKAVDVIKSFYSLKKLMKITLLDYLITL